MSKRLIVPLIFGLLGVGILIGLGVWQVQRLAWKEGILDTIATRMDAAPIALPAEPKEAVHEYAMVQVSGQLGVEELHVITSQRGAGPGYRVVTALEMPGGRRIMVDRGFIAETAKLTDRPAGPVTLQGRLLWPDETDSYTPAPDTRGNVWFAREVNAMADALGAEPLLVVAETMSDTRNAPVPMPAGVNIPNDHLQYAITWFSLAVVWLGMTLYWIIRIRRNTA